MTARGRRPLGIGLVSVGWMGRAHSRAYRGVLERYPELTVQPELVVAADVDEDHRADATSLLGYAEATDDWRRVIDDPRVEALSICAPNHLHRDVAVAAARAGVPFWIEKPMGVSLAASDEIVRAVERAGIVTAVGFSYRTPPAIRRARAEIAAGVLGRVTSVRVSFLADYAAAPDCPLTWRFRRETAGSGVYGDLLSHGFDLASYLVGPIAEVVAQQQTVIPERPTPSGATLGHAGRATGPRARVENEDHATVLARFASGALGVFEASRVAVGPRSEYRIEVYGTEGSLRWDFQRMDELELAVRGDARYGYTTLHAQPGDGDFARFQPGAGTAMGFDDLKTIEAAQFLASVATGEQHGPSVVDGRAAAAVADAAERSATTRRWVAVG